MRLGQTSNYDRTARQSGSVVTKHPLAVRLLSLLYNEAEDRLVFVAADEAGTRLAPVLTRRLTARLIDGVAAILEKSNLAASTMPADIQADLVLLEHQEAVAHRPYGSSKTDGGSPDARPETGRRMQLPNIFVTSVDIVTRPTHFEIHIRNGKAVAAHFNCNRPELHRVLDMLVARASQADWGIAVKAEWLAPDRLRSAMN